MRTILMESGKIHIYLGENFCLMECDNKDNDEAGTPIAIVLDPSSFAIVILGALCKQALPPLSLSSASKPW
jgi:hypothetical protein